MKIDFKDNVIHRFNTLASTNTFAEEMLAASRPPEGTMIVATIQTSGKGAGENCWESEAGENLLTSIILYPDFLPAEDQFLLNKAVSLAVLRCIKHFTAHENIAIKWPNDIYAGNNKIGGILIKNTISGHKIQSSIVGIGLNINQEKFSAGLPNPVSLKHLIGRETDIEKVITVLKDFIGDEYFNLTKGRFDALNSEYLRNLLNYNKPARYMAGNGFFEGIICGVNKFGRLQVKVGEATQEFDFKEIVFLFDL